MARRIQDNIMSRKKGFFGKFGCLTEILIMVISIIAFSYLINPHDVVSAAKLVSDVCCEKTKDGAWCQITKPSNCDTTKFLSSPTSCDSTSFCKSGCCYDSSEGICMTNTPQRVCQESKGVWDTDEKCSISQCQLGCCILGTQAAFTTLVRCKKLSANYNLEVDFRKSITTEAECAMTASLSDEGACVFEIDFLKTCKFGTRQECNNIGKQSGANMTSNVTFYKDYLCSSESLGTNCGPTQQTTCLPGKDGVYFVDTCGNPANVYDSQKVADKAYWNKIIKQTDSCGFGNTNGNSNSKTCGNCNYFSGSICKKADRTNRANYGDNICKNLDCTLEDGSVKRNGESWCSTEKPQGKNDTVGSRYYTHMCSNGEEIIEPCADFRQEVCSQGSITTGGVTFSQARCIVNRWQDCFAQESKSACENSALRDCKWTGFKVGGAITPSVMLLTGPARPGQSTGFKTEYSCVPINSPGLQFWNDETQASAVCGAGTVHCKIKEEKKAPEYKWKCVDNCECDDDSWKDAQNLKCQAYGDCGSKVNYVGSSGEKGFKYSIEKIFMPLLKPLAYGFILLSGNKGIASADTATTVVGLGAVGATAAVAALPFVGWAWGAGTYAESFSIFRGGSAFGYSATSALVWAVGAYFIGQLLGSILGLSEGQTEGISLGLAAGALTYKLIQIARLGASGGPAGWIAFAVAVVVYLFTSKDVRYKYVTFECKPYTSTVKGNDCEKCNTDTDKYPCTDYRCKSLGQACTLVNQGTSKIMCIWNNTRDVTSPTIEPMQDVLTPGYKYISTGVRPPARGFEIQKENNGCVEPFTRLTFGIKTNEAAKCKIDYNRSGSFDNMTYWFGGSSFNEYNHTQTMSLPGPDAINSVPNISIKNSGEYQLFVKCQDANGNANVDDYVIKFCVDPAPDTTPARVEATSILNGAPIQYNANATAVEFYLNEPAECKWSKSDQTYSSMENTMSCDTSLVQMNAQMLYTCRATLTGLKNKEDNTFYVRCKDQPWKPESSRNTNQQSYKFVLKGTQPLNIMSVKPSSETIKGSTTLVPVYLEVQTDNGYNFGDSTCYYGTSKTSINVPFLETGTNKHKQRQDLPSGSYTYYVKCVDLGGNSDTKETRFKVEVDQQAPKVIRAFNYEGQLVAKTDEVSSCSYNTVSSTGCNFRISEGSVMPYDNSTEHSTEWVVGKTFYIKCIDSSGNEPAPDDCSITVKTIQ